MGLVRKHALFRLTAFGWWLAVAGSVFAIASGWVEPYVSPTVIPSGEIGFFGSIVALGLLGMYVLKWIEIRFWKRMGKQVGLESEGIGFLSKPDLTGTVDGRPVRASTYKVKKSGADEGGSTTVTYTLVEADLQEPTDDGFIVGRGDPSSYDEDLPGQIGRDVLDDGHFFIGAVSEDYGRSLVTPRVRDALASVDAVVVGDPTDALMSPLQDEMDGGLGSMMSAGFESMLGDKESFAADAASHDEKGALLDADELAARVEAVVAVADAQAAASVDAARTESTTE